MASNNNNLESFIDGSMDLEALYVLKTVIDNTNLGTDTTNPNVISVKREDKPIARIYPEMRYAKLVPDTRHLDCYAMMKESLLKLGYDLSS